MILSQRPWPHGLRSFRRQLRFASPDDYRILGLAKGCNPDQVNAAFRRLAKQWHPDNNPTPEAKKMFHRVYRARAALLAACAAAPAAETAQDMWGYPSGGHTDRRGVYAGTRPRSARCGSKGRRASATPTQMVVVAELRREFFRFCWLVCFGLAGYACYVNSVEVHRRKEIQRRVLAQEQSGVRGPAKATSPHSPSYALSEGGVGHET